jgi:DNA polymerase I
MKKKFVIIDAMALAYKAYFAFISRPLVTTKGEPTSATYGFFTQLIKILTDIKPDYAAVAFDSYGKTFRHEQYESYKSNRMDMPDDMIPQIKRIKDIIELLGIPLYILERFEADDIIGTAVCKAEEEGLQTYIITPDKDFNQLVTENVFVVRPGGKSGDEITLYNIAKVKEEFGFDPPQMIDYLALIGDKSDDIPGVAGVGPKSAIPLIQEYGSVEGIYQNIEKIDKKGLKAKLLEGRDNAILSKKLATIHCEVPLEFDFDKAVFRKPDLDKVKDVFVELEFNNLYPRLSSVYSKDENENTPVIKEFSIPLESFDEAKAHYKCITTYKEAEDLADTLLSISVFAFDTETDDLNHHICKLAGVSFSFKSYEGYYVALNPFKSDEELFVKYKERLPLADFVKLFKPVFDNINSKKICQNGKFDISILRSHGINVNNLWFDTMLASYVLDPDQKHGMNELSRKYLNYNPIPLSSLIGEKKDPSKILDVELSAITCYSCEDADVTWRLYNVLKEEVDKNSLNDLAYNIEFPLVPVLEDMEREGVKIDTEALSVFSNDLQIMLDEYTRRIYECCGQQFNINSPKQLQVILFDKLGLKTGKKTKTGFSTDARSLETLKGEHEAIDLILDFRQISKLKSTYSDALPALIEPSTGRIHTSFNQTVAATGRLSSNEPNLQNIPIRTELGREIRKAFVPRNKDFVILSADYSQIELRIMASISNDDNLVAAFSNNEDIHRRTASLVFMVPQEQVTPEMRRRAKEVNFGILYGIGAFGLKTRLGVTQYHAKEIIDTYFNTFRSVRKFMDDSIQNARDKGFAETLKGRRRFLRNINSSNRVVRQFEERVAINMPIQGTAADMIKIAMINIHKELTRRKTRTRMVLQVHDELLFDAHKDEVDELRPLIKELMEDALPLNVPVVAETGVGDNWLDAH